MEARGGFFGYLVVKNQKQTAGLTEKNAQSSEISGFLFLGCVPLPPSSNYRHCRPGREADIRPEIMMREIVVGCCGAIHQSDGVGGERSWRYISRCETTKPRMQSWQMANEVVLVFEIPRD